jgi:competence protein ComEA
MSMPVAVADDSGMVNINTASAEQLAALPRIGPAIAQRIVAYREKNGPFKRPADLMNVKGIGESTFLQLKDLITTGQKAEG